MLSWTWKPKAFYASDAPAGFRESLGGAAGVTEDEVRAHDPGRDAIKEALVSQFRYENKRVPLGYPVLNALGPDQSW